MPAQPLRVLVVDDNHDNADIIRQYLEATLEYTVTVAYDGDEALRAFKESRPSVVLLDVMMPIRDGWEVCRSIKRDSGQAATTRVIMVTARDDLADKRTAIESGADDFLEKPLDLTKLLATVRRNAATLGGTTGSTGGAVPASGGMSARSAKSAMRA
jgi:DNA-binding response OmpR family regulator